MATIPIYERRREIGAPARPTQVSTGAAGAAYDALARGAAQVGGQVVHIAEKAMRQDEAKLEDDNALAATNALSTGDEYWNKRQNELQKQWKVGDPPIEDTLNKEFATWKADQRKSLGTEKSRNWFDSNAERMRSRMSQATYNWQQKTRRDVSVQRLQETEDTDARILEADPDRYNEVSGRTLTGIGAQQEIDEADKLAIGRRYQRRMAGTAELAHMKADPEGFYRSRVEAQQAVDGPQAAADAAGPKAARVDGSIPAAGRALLETISGPESEGQYDIRFGGAGKKGVKFDLSKGVHPGIMEPTEDGKMSSAAGKYQFTKTTWDELTGGKVPFTKENQDKFAWVLAQRDYKARTGKDLLTDLEVNGLTPAMSDALAPTWRGLSKRGDKMAAAYQQHLAQGGAGASSGTGVGAGREAIKIKHGATASWDALDEGTKFQMLDQAQTMMRQNNALARQETERLLTDAQAMHADGKQDPFNISLEHMVKTYGADGPRLYAQYKAGQSMATDIASYQTKSDTEILASLAETAPAETEGYAAGDARQNMRLQAAKKVVDERNADPATAVLKSSPKVAEAAKLAAAGGQQGQPGSAIPYASATLAEQQRLGVKQPRILSLAQADAIAGQFQDQAKGAANAADLMASLQAQYGSYFPQVFQQLQASEKMPPEAIVIPNMKDPVSRANMAAVAKIKDEDLRKMVPAGTEQDVAGQVLKNLQEFQGTTVGMQGGGSRTFALVQQSAQKLAMYYVAAGKSPKEAAAQAYEETVGHAYQFEGSYRIPKTEQPDAVIDGVALVTKELATLPIAIPPAPAGMRPADVEAQYRDALEDNAVFATNADESGVVLYQKTPTGLVPVRAKGGQQIGYSWQELRTRATAAAQAGPTTFLGIPVFKSDVPKLTPEEKERRRQTISVPFSVGF